MHTFVANATVCSDNGHSFTASQVRLWVTIKRFFARWSTEVHGSPGVLCFPARRRWVDIHEADRVKPLQTSAVVFLNYQIESCIVPHWGWKVAGVDVIGQLSRWRHNVADIQHAFDVIKDHGNILVAVEIL